jgi:predicted nucleotidyltransferase
MMSRKDILEKLRELKPILSRDYSLKEIGLFGSYASDSANDDSDIGWKFFSLEIYLEQIFG